MVKIFGFLLPALFLVTFAAMRNTTASIGYLLLVVSLTLILKDYGFLAGAVVHDQLTCPIECSHTSGQAEQVLSDSHGDEVFANSAKARPQEFQGFTGVFPKVTEFRVRSFNSTIWEPPRES
jgi:hypothetical protein